MFIKSGHRSLSPTVDHLAFIFPINVVFIGDDESLFGHCGQGPQRHQPRRFHPLHVAHAGLQAQVATVDHRR